MIKAIVSVKNMLVNLNLLPEADEYDVTFRHGRLDVGNVAISCECQNFDRVFKIESKHIKRLIKIFELLEEQPATIAIDGDGWLYIKEAII